MFHVFGDCPFTSVGGYLALDMEMKNHYVDSSYMPEQAVLTALNTKGLWVLERNNRSKDSSRKIWAEKKAQAQESFFCISK